VKNGATVAGMTCGSRLKVAISQEDSVRSGRDDIDFAEMKFDLVRSRADLAR